MVSVPAPGGDYLPTAIFQYSIGNHPVFDRENRPLQTLTLQNL
jgi:hypothetical protein